MELKTTYDAENKIWSGIEEKNAIDIEKSVGQLIYDKLKQHPNNIYQISATEHTTLTNEQLLSSAIKIAIFLRDEGITQDDIIGISAKNTTYLAAVLLACFFECIPFHAMSPYHDDETTRNLILITKPKIFICDEENYEKIRYGTESVNTKILTMKPRLNGHFRDNILDILETTTNNHNNYQPAQLKYDPDQTMAILCTSGTSGVPKALTISNRKLCSLNFAGRQNSPDYVEHVPSTIDWISGLHPLVAITGNTGKRIISERPFQAEHFIEWVQKYKITATFQPPRNMTLLINNENITAEKLDTMHIFWVGGETTTAEKKRKMQSYLKNGILIFGYGMSEIGGVCMNTNIHEKPNSSGQLMSNIKVKIIDDDGKSLGPNGIGEIIVHNGEQWNGYYANKEATDALRNKEGWFYTGDLGYFDDEGFLYVNGRKKELLKWVGMHFYPQEVEKIIREIPDVADVCVFSVHNELKGDAAGAVIVKVAGSNLTAQDIIKFVEKRTPAKHKQLNAGAVIVDNLITNINGKEDRNAIKKAYQNLLQKIIV